MAIANRNSRGITVQLTEDEYALLYQIQRMHWAGFADAGVFKRHRSHGHRQVQKGFVTALNKWKMQKFLLAPDKVEKKSNSGCVATPADAP